MTRKKLLFATITAISLLIGLGGCATKPSDTGGSQVGNIREFSFEGGYVEDGRVFLSSDVEIEVDPETKAVFLRKPGIEIECSCFLENSSGSCFAVSNDGPGGTVIVDCACTNDCCSDIMEHFCVMDIEEEDGFKLKFHAFTKASQ